MLQKLNWTCHLNLTLVIKDEETHLQKGFWQEPIVFAMTLLTFVL